MKHRYTVFLIVCAGMLGLVTSSLLHAQSWVSEAESNGYTLKKVVSDTAIATGQNFSYTIYFSIPAGASSVTITDMLPPALSFQTISVTSACGSPTVSTPAVGSSGGSVVLNWATVPSGCSGSFVVTVNFPNGTTCDGTSARNRVCLTGEIAGTFADFCTGYVSTRAIAADPWHVGKWILGAGSQPGSCGKVTADSVVTYRICVWKNVGTTGQLNIDNGIVTDTLPAGAMLVPGSSSCGMTQSGNVITWNVGALSALPMYNTQCCTFKVLYPSALFPTGSQIHNQATLTGTLGSANAPCGQATHISNETCVEIKQVTSATFSKYVYTNGQPGCSGKYRIWLCNNGSLPIDTLVLTDTIPSPLTSITLGGASGGVSTSISGSVVTVTLTSPLMPTQCRYVDIEFLIPSTATPGTTVSNCALLYIPGLPPQQACASFTINAPEPKPCLWKQVCNEQPTYEPGDVFRYRLRVQNIGGQPITGATITDVLDPNLQYAGSPSYYTAASWNAPCQTTSNWSGVGFSQSGNTLTFTLPTIAAECQDIFYNHCGMYGTAGIPFYFIEFDVMVTDTAALGNIPNRFTIDGGNLSGPTTSNTDYVTVVGTAGFTLEKSVTADTLGWASSLSTTAPSTVNYRLRLTVAPGSVGLRHITFADLLPRDDGTNDALILGPCTPRGSLFDMAFTSTISLSPLATEYSNPLSFAAVNGFAPSGAPGAMFTGGCGTLGTWSAGLSAGDMNLGYYFGPTPVAAGNTATSVFGATVPASALPPDSACNTFAANAAVRHLINSAIVSDQPIGALESNAACVTVEKSSGSEDTCFTVQLKSAVAAGTNPSGECEYNIILTVNNPAAGAVAGWFDSDQGVLTPATMSIPSGTSTQTLVFTDTAPPDSAICIRYGIINQQQQRVLCDSICFDIPPCGEEDPCDSLSVKVTSVTATGTNATGDCMYKVELSTSNSGSVAATMWFDTFAGSIAPPTLNIPPGGSTQSLTFTDTPPTDNVVCLRFGYTDVQGVRVLCDSICFDVPPCEEEHCDSLINGTLDTSCCEYDVTILNAVGTPITSIDYMITGGTVNSIMTAPCAPVSPAPPGSAAGTLTYSPPCAGSLGFSIQASPSSPGGTVTVTLVVHHGQKDSCRLQFSYSCGETHQEPEICDKVKVKPFLFTGLNLSGRTFTVSNTKIPASPITSIDIDPVSVPCFLQGGGLKVDFTPTPWSVPYTRIPISGTISATTQVKFNLGVDYTCSWMGVINLTIHHADGDSCMYTYGPWDASPPGTGGGVVLTSGLGKKVYANRLRIQNTNSTRSVKWVSVNVESDSSVIVAGSGDHWEGTALEPRDAVLDGYEQGRTEAMFSFETPVAPSTFSDFFNLVVARDTTMTDPPVIRWITYDENGDAIATDTVRITTPVLSIRGDGVAPAPGDFRLLNSWPNPVRDAATVAYELDRGMAIRLDLFDKLGQYIETLDEGFRSGGRQSLRFSAAHLPVGTYYLRLSSGDTHVIKPLVIMR